jgi:hypothetical protein
VEAKLADARKQLEEAKSETKVAQDVVREAKKHLTAKRVEVTSAGTTVRNTQSQFNRYHIAMLLDYVVLIVLRSLVHL